MSRVALVSPGTMFVASLSKVMKARRPRYRSVRRSWGTFPVLVGLTRGVEAAVIAQVDLGVVTPVRRAQAVADDWKTTKRPSPETAVQRKHCCPSALAPRRTGHELPVRPGDPVPSEDVAQRIGIAANDCSPPNRTRRTGYRPTPRGPSRHRPVSRSRHWPHRGAGTGGRRLNLASGHVAQEHINLAIRVPGGPSWRRHCRKPPNGRRRRRPAGLTCCCALPPGVALIRSIGTAACAVGPEARDVAPTASTAPLRPLRPGTESEVTLGASARFPRSGESRDTFSPGPMDRKGR